MEVANRDALEAAFGRKLTRLSAGHRRELKTLLGSPPDVERVPDSFWAKVREEIDQQAAAALLLIFLAGAVTHGAARKDAQDQARKFATGRAAKLARDYARHSADRLKEVGERWKQDPPASTEGDLKTIFGPDRSSMVATTETTIAATSGGEHGIEITVGRDPDDTWFTRSDGKVCTTCEPLHNRKRSIWGRKFMDGPPAHPGCRCWIQYARKLVTA